MILTSLHRVVLNIRLEECRKIVSNSLSYIHNNYHTYTTAILLFNLIYFGVISDYCDKIGCYSYNIVYHT